MSHNLWVAAFLIQEIIPRNSARIIIAGNQTVQPGKFIQKCFCFQQKNSQIYQLSVSGGSEKFDH